MSYGLSELATYRALDVRLENFSSRFTVLRHGQLLGEVALEDSRRAERRNALGVVALATELGIAWNQIVSALAEFRGAARRFEVKYHSADYMVVDDYAHHPTEIKATLAAAKQQRLEAGAGAFSTAPLLAHAGAARRIRRRVPRCRRRFSSPKFTPRAKPPWRASPARRWRKACAPTATRTSTTSRRSGRLRAAVNAILAAGRSRHHARRGRHSPRRAAPRAGTRPGTRN